MSSFPARAVNLPTLGGFLTIVDRSDSTASVPPAKRVGGGARGRRLATGLLAGERVRGELAFWRVFAGRQYRPTKNVWFLRGCHVGQVGQRRRFVFVGRLEECVSDSTARRRFAWCDCRTRGGVAPRSGDECVTTRSVGTRGPRGEFSKNGDRAGTPEHPQPSKSRGHFL